MTNLLLTINFIATATLIFFTLTQKEQRTSAYTTLMHRLNTYRARLSGLLTSIRTRIKLTTQERTTLSHNGHGYNPPVEIKAPPLPKSRHSSRFVSEETLR